MGRSFDSITAGAKRIEAVLKAMLKLVFTKMTQAQTTAQKMKFAIKDFFIKCDQNRGFLWIWSFLLKKSLMENFIFCAVNATLLIVYFF